MDKFNAQLLAQAIATALDGKYDEDKDILLSAEVVGNNNDTVWVTSNEDSDDEQDFVITIEEDR